MSCTGSILTIATANASWLPDVCDCAAAYAQHSRGPGAFHDVEFGGRHIHHLVWGILLLLIVGYGWLLQIGTDQRAHSRWPGRTMSFLYGVGAALTLDEFALWLNLQDVYWERQGRENIDAVLLFGALPGIGIIGGRFLGALGWEALAPRRSKTHPHIHR